MSDTLAQIAATVYAGRLSEMPDLTRKALAEGLPAQDILDNGLIAGMDLIGAEFKKGKKFVPEVLLAARTMQSSVELLRPFLAEGGARMVGKVLIGTVKGDLHDIGKNLVAMMLEGAGFQVVDLGKDVAPDKFIEAIKREQPHIVALSALLTTTMRAMGDTVTVLKEAGVRDGLCILVGGAPVTSEFARQIGADAYASNAPAAVEIAKKLVSRQ